MNNYLKFINIFLVLLLCIVAFAIGYDKFMSGDRSIVKDDYTIEFTNAENRARYIEAIKNGDQYMVVGEFERALSEYIVASNLKEDAIETYVKIGKVYVIEGDLDRAYSMVNTIYNIYPNASEGTVLEAKIFFKKSEYNNARDTLLRSLNINKDDTDLKYYLALSYIGLGEYDNSRLILSEIVEDDFKSKVLLEAYENFDRYSDGTIYFLDTWLAKELIVNYEIDLARYILKRSIANIPNYRDAWTYLAVTYYLDKNYDDALLSIKRSLSLDDSNPIALFYLGEIFFQLGKYEDAIGAYNKSIDNGYNNKNIINDKLARSYILIGQYDLAKLVYTKYLLKKDNLDKVTPEMYAKPIWLMLYKLNNKDMALQFAYLALNAIDNAITNNNVGWVLLEMGDLDKAEFYLNKAYSLDQTLPQLYLNLGELNLKKGNNSDAIKNFKVCFDLDKSKEIGLYCEEKVTSL